MHNTSKMAEAVISYFPSKFDLPSFDPDSLAILAYSKFGNASLHTHTECFGRFRFLQQDGEIPTLTNGSKVAKDVESAIDMLRELEFGTDFHLSQRQCADSVAFIEMMKSKLRPALMHIYWLEETNYSEVTREAYATSLSLPTSIFYPRRNYLEAVEFVYTSEGGNMEFLERSDIEHKIYNDAVFCINYLSDKLGSQAFLFGDKPTTADAIMFGYLAPLLKIPFPKNRLKESIQSCQNLCNTIKHILNRYFPSVKSGVSPTTGGYDEDKEFPNQGRDTFIAIVFGLTVIVTYALLRGVIPIGGDDID